MDKRMNPPLYKKSLKGFAIVLCDNDLFYNMKKVQINSTKFTWYQTRFPLSLVFYFNHVTRFSEDHWLLTLYRGKVKLERNLFDCLRFILKFVLTFSRVLCIMRNKMITFVLEFMYSR